MRAVFGWKRALVAESGGWHASLNFEGKKLQHFVPSPSLGVLEVRRLSRQACVGLASRDRSAARSIGLACAGQYPLVELTLRIFSGVNETEIVRARVSIKS
jgi:hypothetical protein